MLRGELGYDGVVVTDDLSMGAIADHYEFADAVVRAVLAGCDLILFGHGYDLAETAMDALEHAYGSGELTEERLGESVRRILRLKIRHGLRDAPAGPVDVEELNEKAMRLLETEH